MSSGPTRSSVQHRRWPDHWPGVAFGKGEGAQYIVFYNVVGHSEKAKQPNTLHFRLFSRLRRERKLPANSRQISGGKLPANSQQTPGKHPTNSRPIAGKFPTISRQSPENLPANSQQTPGKFPANARQTPGKFPASSRQIPGKFPANSRQTPGKIRHNPESVHLKGLSSDGRIVRPTYILQCFRTFGEDEAAQKRISYNFFAPSERAKEPNTLYFTLFSRLQKKRRGQTQCIVHCFRAFGNGEAAKHLAFYLVFAPSE